MKKTGKSNELTLKVSYEKREGKKEESTETVNLSNPGDIYYDHNGVRKAVLLSRYGELLKDWLKHERNDYRQYYTRLIIKVDECIVIPKLCEEEIDTWERKSLPLKVSAEYVELFKRFKRYFKEEMSTIDDDSLEQEFKILNLLSSKKKQYLKSDKKVVSVP